MNKDTKEYWNNVYWLQNIEANKDKKENMSFLEDLWPEKYNLVFDNVPRGKALDLGCGLGQYTNYLKEKGFDVLSCDISEHVLEKLQENIPDAKTLELDMSQPLPFENNSFDLVFANLAIHYFDSETTLRLLKEIRRILTNDGYFIGSVNSSETFKFLNVGTIELESNYYQEKDREGYRYVRLWNKEQFDFFFQDYDFDVLEEITTTRWGRPKIMWEFFAKPKTHNKDK